MLCRSQAHVITDIRTVEAVVAVVESLPSRHGSHGTGRCEQQFVQFNPAKAQMTLAFPVPGHPEHIQR